jgi:hypothetical protein
MRQCGRRRHTLAGSDTFARLIVMITINGNKDYADRLCR